jgi:hypothetical protein
MRNSRPARTPSSGESQSSDPMMKRNADKRIHEKNATTEHNAKRS